MRYFVLSLLLLCSVILSSCSSLESVSGLYDVKLEHSYKMAVDGSWCWGKGNPFPGKRGGYIYVAPMDISLVEGKEPVRARLLVPQMCDYITEEVGRALAEGNKVNHTNWRLTKNRSIADIRIDIALVRFSPQNPGMRVVSTVGGVFCPIPGVSGIVGHLAQGDIGIEATVRNNHNGELLMAVKDSNRKSARLYSAEAYSRSGNADVNLRTWARKLGRLFRASFPDKLGDNTLKDKIDDRSLIDAAASRMAD